MLLFFMLFDFIDTSVHAEIHKARIDYDSNLVSNLLQLNLLSLLINVTRVN